MYCKCHRYPRMYSDYPTNTNSYNNNLKIDFFRIQYKLRVCKVITINTSRYLVVQHAFGFVGKSEVFR